MRGSASGASFQDGLHGFLTAFIRATAVLGEDIERFYIA
jgi:hypothetical protein